MQGAALHTSVQEVEAFWQDFAVAHGFVRSDSGVREPGELEETGETVAAYVSDSRWVADCPRCGAGMAAWPEAPKVCCLDCGSLYAVSFPKPRELAAALTVLEARPDQSTRNWRPEDEDVADLKAENALRGLDFATSALGTVES